MENESSNSCCQLTKKPHLVVALAAIILVAGIVIVSILRERIVTPVQNQVAIVGQGRVLNQPDTATVNLGVQVDKAADAATALKQLNEKMTGITQAMERIGIKKENVQTQNYSLNPQYDYLDGVSKVSGYTANQQVSIKVDKLRDNQNLLTQVIDEANKAGSNQILGVKFDSTNLSDLKQKARVLAIQDAKSKKAELEKAAGVKLGKIIGWYDTILQSPDMNDVSGGYGAGAEMNAQKAATPTPSPQLPSGEQEIVIEVSLNYEVK